MKHVISLGAGVQSSTMALMAAEGAITPRPDFAVFADTQAEPPSVYRWLDWLEKALPFLVHRVTAGDLRAEATTMKRTKDGRAFSKTAVPVFTLNEDGSQGRIPHRTCTRDFKIRPILKDIRQVIGRSAMKAWRSKHSVALSVISEVEKTNRSIRKDNKGRKKKGLDLLPLMPEPLTEWRECQEDALVTQWMGISLDEINRVRNSRDPWSVHRYPLIELRMTRHLCLEWMRENGYPEPPRSACTFCPFHSKAEWRRLRDEEPEAFADAVEFERELQEIKAASDTFKSKPFLTRDLVPLDQVDLRSDFDKGQLPLWQDECSGVCGV